LLSRFHFAACLNKLVKRDGLPFIPQTSVQASRCSRTIQTFFLQPNRSNQKASFLAILMPTFIKVNI
jgi:hypothetical protein